MTDLKVCLTGRNALEECYQGVSSEAKACETAEFEMEIGPSDFVDGL